MAIVVKKKRKATPTSWKKGIKSPNPKGRGIQYMPAAKLTRIYTAEVIAKVYGELIDKTEDQLNGIVRNPNMAIIDKIIAKSMLHDLKNSSPCNTERVLVRVIGPVAVRQELAGAGGLPLVPPTIVIQEVEAAKAV